VAAVAEKPVATVGHCLGGVRPVDRQLVGVDADAVAAGVAVREEAGLPHSGRS